MRIGPLGPAVAALAEIAGARAASLHTVDRRWRAGNGRPRADYAAGRVDHRVDPAAVARYYRDLAEHDPWLSLPRAAPGALVGQPCAPIAGRFEEGFLRPQGLTRGVTAIMACEDTLMTRLDLWARRAIDASPALRAALGHLRVALALQQRLASWRARPARPLPGCPELVLLLDVQARLLRSEPRTRTPDGWPIGTEGAVWQAPGADHERLCRALGRALREGAFTSWQAESGAIAVAPLAPEPRSPGARLPAAMVALYGPLRADPDRVALARLHGLTPGEARFAAELMKGGTVAECAGRLRIGVHTARTHLKRALAKTATGRQADLLWLLRTGPCALR